MNEYDELEIEVIEIVNEDVISQSLNPGDMPWG